MIFRYEALDNQGAKTTGLVEADNSQEADSLLKDNGLILVSLEVANIKKGLSLPFLGRISMKDIVIFARQFSIMISAGVPMVQSLRILVNQTENKKFKNVIKAYWESIKLDPFWRGNYIDLIKYLLKKN